MQTEWARLIALAAALLVAEPSIAAERSREVAAQFQHANPCPLASGLARAPATSKTTSTRSATVGRMPSRTCNGKRSRMLGQRIGGNALSAGQDSESERGAPDDWTWRPPRSGLSAPAAARAGIMFERSRF
jgi:hypothetical protein